MIDCNIGECDDCFPKRGYEVVVLFLHSMKKGRWYSVSSYICCVFAVVYSMSCTSMNGSNETQIEHAGWSAGQFGGFGHGGSDAFCGRV